MCDSRHLFRTSGLRAHDQYLLWRDVIKYQHKNLLLHRYAAHPAGNELREGWVEDFFAYAIEVTFGGAKFACAVHPYKERDLQCPDSNLGFFGTDVLAVHSALRESMHRISQVGKGPHLPTMMVLKEFAAWNQTVLAKIPPNPSSEHRGQIDRRIELTRGIMSDPELRQLTCYSEMNRALTAIWRKLDGISQGWSDMETTVSDDLQNLQGKLQVLLVHMLQFSFLILRREESHGVDVSNPDDSLLKSGSGRMWKRLVDDPHVRSNLQSNEHPEGKSFPPLDQRGTAVLLREIGLKSATQLSQGLLVSDDLEVSALNQAVKLRLELHTRIVALAKAAILVRHLHSIAKHCGMILISQDYFKEHVRNHLEMANKVCISLESHVARLTQIVFDGRAASRRSTSSVWSSSLAALSIFEREGGVFPEIKEDIHNLQMTVSTLEVRQSVVQAHEKFVAYTQELQVMLSLGEEWWPPDFVRSLHRSLPSLPHASQSLVPPEDPITVVPEPDELPEPMPLERRPPFLERLLVYPPPFVKMVLSRRPRAHRCHSNYEHSRVRRSFSSPQISTSPLIDCVEALYESEDSDHGELPPGVQQAVESQPMIEPEEVPQLTNISEDPIHRHRARRSFSFPQISISPGIGQGELNSTPLCRS